VYIVTAAAAARLQNQQRTDNNSITGIGAVDFARRARSADTPLAECSTFHAGERPQCRPINISSSLARRAEAPAKESDSDVPSAEE